MAGLERSRRVTTAALYLRDQDGDGYDLVGSSATRARVPASPHRAAWSLAARPCSTASEAAVDLARRARARGQRGATARPHGRRTLGTLRSSVVLAIRGDDDDGASAVSSSA